MPATIENHPLREGPPPANPFAAPPGAASAAIPGTFVREQARQTQPMPAASTAPTTNRSAWGSVAQPPARPTPLPKRSKGRLLVAAFLLALGFALSVGVWNLFLRYEAYGIIEGRIIEVSAPWDGMVRSQVVREGEQVTQGDVLLTVENPGDEAELARVGDELRIAEAELQARSAELRLAAQLRGDWRHKAQAEYYEIYGTLLQEQSRLLELQSRRDRNHTLDRRAAVSKEEAEASRLAEHGQRAKIEKLKEAVAEMEQRVTLANESLNEADELKPKLVRIEAIQAEIARLRKRIASGQVRAPVGGRVIRRLQFTGERVSTDRPVLELLENDSLQVVVYLPQSKATVLRPGQQVTVLADGEAGRVPCTVERIGDRFETAPPPLVRYYSPNEQLLPVYLRPMPSGTVAAALRLGCVVRLPRSWPLDFVN